MNLQGAAVGDTVIHGFVNYTFGEAAENVDSVTVSNITFSPAEGDDINQALCWGNAQGLSLNVENCAFDGWRYGIGVNSGSSGCTLNVSDTVFTDTFCAMSVNNKNNVGKLWNVDTSGAVYAGQSFSSAGTAAENGRPDDGYYHSTGDFFENANPVENVIRPSGNSWEAYVSTDEGVKFGTLEDLVASAGQDGLTTIELTSDIELDSMLSIHTGLTIEGNAHIVTAAEDFAPGENGQISLIKVDSATGPVTFSDLILRATSGNKHVLDVWGTQGVTLSYVTLDHSAAQSGAPLVINGSGVEVTGRITLITGENSWYAADVDAKNGTASLSVAEGASIGVYGNDEINYIKVENSSTEEGEHATATFNPGNGQSSITSDGTEEGKYTPAYPNGATYNGTAYVSLQGAIDAAKQNGGGTVTLNSNILLTDQVVIPDGVSIDGGGHTATLVREVTDGALFSVEGDNVNISNLVIDAYGLAKHGVQFYMAEGGSLTDCTVKNSYFTAVLVNGSTDVVISGCTLEPTWASGQREAPYANIELAIGAFVKTIPTVTLKDNKLGGDATHQVWVDRPTVENILDLGVKPGSRDDILRYVNGLVTNLGSSDVTVTVQLDEGGKGEDTVVDGVRPVTPPSQSGDRVNVADTDGGTVKVTPTRADEGDEVAITATPDEGQEVRSVSVTDKDGKAVEVTDNGDGTWTFVQPDGAVTVTVAFRCDGGDLCLTHSFTDVDQDAWYHDAIDWAVENGVLNGYGEGGTTLGPVADVTRAEMAQMLWNQAGRPGVEADLSGFGDVSADGWYAQALAWCVSEGIFSGYGDTFGTERTISREEAATVLWRIAGSPEADADLSGYGDASSVSEYATDAIEWAVANGVLTGKGGVALDPQAGCTRGEVAAMMMRMAQ